MPDPVPTYNTEASQPPPAEAQVSTPTEASPSPPTESYFDSGEYCEQKYNSLTHKVDLYLSNTGDFTQELYKYKINPAAVLNLQISDTVNDWIVEGTMTFMYVPENINVQLNATGQAAKTAVDGAADAGKTLSNYVFRGDGFDLLRIMIIPLQHESNPKWMLSYVCSVYEVEDISNIPEIQGIPSSYMKCLKLKFHDVRYQMLKTANIEYSTATPKSDKLTPNFETEIAKKQGVLFTGDTLRDIFNDVLANPANGGLKDFEIPQDSPEWDKGAGEIFYTSPAQFSAADDVDYIYSHHVSSKKLEGVDDLAANDLCLLHTDRPDKVGAIEPIVLTSVADFFKKAGKDSPGELQKEHFFITALTTEEGAGKMYKAPTSTGQEDRDFTTDKYSQIVSYSFVDMSPAINSNMFCTSPVYSVDIGKREFNIEFKGNDILSVKKLMAKNYITELYSQGRDNPEQLFLPVIHKNKRDLNVFPTFSLNGTNPIARQKNGLHNLLYTGLFQNACVCFKVYGLTWRESGTFIGIDKTDGSVSNDYNNKLFGQWFVVRVDHVFEAGAYMNIIYAVKIHRFNTLLKTFDAVLEDGPGAAPASVTAPEQPAGQPATQEQAAQPAAAQPTPTQPAAAQPTQ